MYHKDNIFIFIILYKHLPIENFKLKKPTTKVKI